MVNLKIAVMVCCVTVPGILAGQEQSAATVSGIVTDSVTHLPIQGVTVSFGATRTNTDFDGAYELSVKPGDAHLQSERRGYLRTDGIDLEARAGDSLRRDFELRPAPRVSGTIIDADTGQPVKGCMVFAMRRISALGEFWYASAGIPTADTRYGAFETVGLDPGDYILEIDDCAWTFYPAVSRIEMATPISVTEAGVRGLSIKLKRSDARRISGVADHGAVDVRLVRHIHDVAQTLAQVRADASGHFEFASVPEGEFHLVTSAGAHEVVEVTDHDLTDVKLRSLPGPRIHSTVLKDGVEIPLQAELVSVFDGEPGPMWPRLGGLPAGSVVASILANNAPLPNGSITIDGAAPELTFIVTSKTGTLSGKVDVKPAEVIAIREPFGEFLDQSSLPRALLNNTGCYRFENLAPGKYRVVTLFGDELFLERNEAFLRKKAALAESVEVTARE